jgi:hypothetical protein
MDAKFSEQEQRQAEDEAQKRGNLILFASIRVHSR